MSVYPKLFSMCFLPKSSSRCWREDILRLQRNYKDSYNLYKDGLTDNIDYQRAQIALSNVQAQRRSTQESVNGKICSSEGN